MKTRERIGIIRRYYSCEELVKIQYMSSVILSFLCFLKSVILSFFLLYKHVILEFQYNLFLFFTLILTAKCINFNKYNFLYQIVLVKQM